MQFKVRFAAGNDSNAFSGVWSVWAHKTKPDLYICAHPIGQIKASLHCPRSDRPTWKRHFGFDADAKGPVVEQGVAQTGTRHKATWIGKEIGGGWTLEWRVFVPARSLRLKPITAPSKTVLAPPPQGDDCLIFLVFVGTQGGGDTLIETNSIEVFHLANGQLCDGRAVRVAYAYATEGKWPMPNFPNHAAAAAIDKQAFNASPNELRMFAVPESFDGTLCFWDLRAEKRLPRPNLSQS